MAFRDREWFIQALEQAKKRVAALQAKIDGHIAAEEFDAAKLLLNDFADALTNANSIANQFADKFGG